MGSPRPPSKPCCFSDRTIVPADLDKPVSPLASRHDDRVFGLDITRFTRSRSSYARRHRHLAPAHRDGAAPPPALDFRTPHSAALVARGFVHWRLSDAASPLDLIAHETRGNGDSGWKVAIGGCGRSWVTRAVPVEQPGPCGLRDPKRDCRGMLLARAFVGFIFLFLVIAFAHFWSAGPHLDAFPSGMLAV